MKNFNNIKVKLSELEVHPDNVRNQQKNENTDQNNQELISNISEFGLLQPLLVQKINKSKYGVVAGSRRLNALNALAKSKKSQFTKSSQIECRLVERDIDVTSLSLSENELQLPMDALDRFEAFSNLVIKGSAITDIARSFGITELSVKQAMRLGNIHPLIREAHRNGILNLEELRVFSGHPDTSIQLEVFEKLNEQDDLSTWRIKQFLTDGTLRIGDPLGQYIYDLYKAENGRISEDLIFEDSIILDQELIERCHEKKLQDDAESERAKYGFAWSDVAINPEWNAFNKFDILYPVHHEHLDVVLDEQKKNQCEKIQKEIEALEIEKEKALNWLEERPIEEKIDDLETKIYYLTHQFKSEDLQKSGVIAVWRGGRLEFKRGMVRPEDQFSENSSGDEKKEQPSTSKYSEALKKDMAQVRTSGIALALAQSNISRLVSDFILISKILLDNSFGISNATNLTCSSSNFLNEDLGVSHSLIKEGFSQIKSELNTDWAKLETEEKRFEAFRKISQQDRDYLYAYAFSQTLNPTLVNQKVETLFGDIEDEILPNIREIWTPDEAFLKRMSKPSLLDILKSDLNMPIEAQALEGSKKSGVVEYLVSLISTPFATLTSEQSSAVNNWAPEILQRKDISVRFDTEEIEEKPNSGDIKKHVVEKTT